MPSICIFNGIRIYINYDDHAPPHFHAKYGEDVVLISISDVEVYSGSMPRKQLRLVLAWAEMHQDELYEEWELAAKHQDLFLIEPLR